MKKFLSVIILSCAFMFTGFANANTKVAIVDVVDVLQKMPQSEVVRKSLNTEFEVRLNKLQAQKEKANEAAQKLQKDGMTLSASEKTKLSNVIKDFEDSYQSYSLDYRKRENEEAGKLLDKIQQAIDTIAKKEKFDLVLKAEATLYATDSVDITDKVLAQVKN